MKLSKNSLHFLQNLTRILWAIFLLTFLFPKRFLLGTIDGNLHGGIVDTFQIYFYFSEILIALVLLGTILFFQKPKFTRPPKLLWGILFILIISTIASLFLTPTPSQNFIYLIHFLEIFALSYIFSLEIIPTEKSIFLILISLASQALLGTFQLTSQHSLGLGFLGENNFNSSTLGIAKIDISDDKYIRPLGTTTHANAYGASMFIGLIFLFIWIKSYLNSDKKNFLNAIRRKKSKHKKILIYAIILGALFFLGAITSFSRAVWGATLLLILWAVHQHKSYKKIYLTIFATLAVFIGIFYEFFSARISTLTQAFSTRTEMYAYSFDIFKANPLGLGIGRFGTYLTDHGDRIFAPWEIIPVHNIFFLIPAELGLLTGSLILVFAIGYIGTFGKNIFYLLSLLGIGIIACTDHFFWTNLPMIFLLAILLILLEREHTAN